MRAFARGVSTEARDALLDFDRVAPFANLRPHDGTVKRHDFRAATG